nr:DUF402 domain-containing protein [Virgisporangium aliadipatigenens]
MSGVGGVRFAAGRVLLHRHFARDKLVFAPVVRVVSDDERGLLLWMPHGTPVIRELAADGAGLRDMSFADWIRVEKRIVMDVHRGPDILKLVPPDGAHSVWWLFGPGQQFAAWYVNLESPSERWDDGDVAGLDLTDFDLDIWVWPNRHWEWKDEDELAERLGFPDHYWVPHPESVWAEGRRVVPAIESGTFPFDGTWCDFRPDPAWELVPAVPEGWDRPKAGR